MYLCKPLCFNDNAKIQNLEPKNKECSPLHQKNMNIKRRLVLLLQYLIQTFHDITRRIRQPMVRLRLIGCDETLSHGLPVFQGEASTKSSATWRFTFQGSKISVLQRPNLIDDNSSLSAGFSAFSSSFRNLISNITRLP